MHFIALNPLSLRRLFLYDCSVVVLRCGIVSLLLLLFIEVINVVVILLGRSWSDSLLLRLSLEELLLAVILLTIVIVVTLRRYSIHA